MQLHRSVPTHQRSRWAPKQTHLRLNWAAIHSPSTPLQRNSSRGPTSRHWRWSLKPPSLHPQAPAIPLRSPLPPPRITKVSIRSPKTSIRPRCAKTGSKLTRADMEISANLRTGKKNLISSAHQRKKTIKELKTAVSSTRRSNACMAPAACSDMSTATTTRSCATTTPSSFTP